MVCKVAINRQITTSANSKFSSEMAQEKFGKFDSFWIGGTMKTVEMNVASAINVWAWTI